MNAEKRLIEQAIDALVRSRGRRQSANLMDEYGRQEMAEADRREAAREVRHAEKLLRMLLEDE